MSHPAAEVVGEVALDPDGVMHGWCWSPGRPAERLTLDILIDDVVAVSVVASRFREDIRNRKFGDGYHGFTVTLTKQLSRLRGGAKVVSARERVSGRVFWQQAFGALGLPDGYDDRLARSAAEIGASAGVIPPERAGRGRMFAAGLAEAGSRLRARARAANVSLTPDLAPPVNLAYTPAPAISLVLEAGADAVATFAVIADAAEAIGAVNAELLVADDGADPRNVYLASRIANLRYFYDERSNRALRRNFMAEECRGDVLVFLAGNGGNFGEGLRDFAALPARPDLVLSPGLARLAGRVEPEFLPLLAGTAPGRYLGLGLAIGRALFAEFGGFDESLGDGRETVDLVLRLLAAGREAMVWGEPASTDAEAAYADGYLPLR
jgi:hypothetical protein